jgi:hypothetical protein
VCAIRVVLDVGKAGQGELLLCDRFESGQCILFVFRTVRACPLFNIVFAIILFSLSFRINPFFSSYSFCDVLGIDKNAVVLVCKCPPKSPCNRSGQCENRALDMDCPPTCEFGDQCLNQVENANAARLYML